MARATETFGTMVLRRRKELGLTQSDVAQRVGVQPNYIVYLEKGERKPSDRTVLRMADALGIDRGDLYLAANPDLREFLNISDGNEVQLAEMSGGLRALTEDRALCDRLAITPDEIDTVAGLRLRGRVTTPAQYAALILSVRYIFA
ncbi:helix-turn-helix transcriptional regulator [Myxococcota bacterium]|nr:helix-turn-helix transcriptional regulator [Myxococcota bacterium]